MYRHILRILSAKEAIGQECGHLNRRGQKLLNWLRLRYAH
jgi:hypothetical protein